MLREKMEGAGRERGSEKGREGWIKAGRPREVRGGERQGDRQRCMETQWEKGRRGKRSGCAREMEQEGRRESGRESGG
eukprot:scaffold15315_cov30-Tisochrysis_lutea.AAC.3